MLFATAHQGLLLLWMLLCGAGIGIWYLLVAGLRRLVRAGFWLTLSCDLLFGAGAAALLTAFLLTGSYGAVRPYALLAAAAGALMSAFVLAPPLQTAGTVLGRLYRRIVTLLAENRLWKVIFK